MKRLTILAWLIGVTGAGVLAWAQEPPGPGPDREPRRERREKREGQSADRPGPGMPAERMEQLFKELDANADGKIDKEEFVRKLPSIMRRMHEQRGPGGPGGPSGPDGDREREAGPKGSRPQGPPPGPAKEIKPGTGPEPASGPGSAEMERRIEDRIARRVRDELQKRLPTLIQRAVREAVGGAGPPPRAERGEFRPPQRDGRGEFGPPRDSRSGGWGPPPWRADGGRERRGCGWGAMRDGNAVTSHAPPQGRGGLGFGSMRDGRDGAPAFQPPRAWRSQPDWGPPTPDSPRHHKRAWAEDCPSY